MKRSCLVYLGIFFGAGILGGFALVLAIPPAPPGFYTPFVMKLAGSLGAAFAASTFLVVAVFGLRDTLQRLRDRAQLGTTSVTTPRDGARTVAVGPVVADGPLLESPFTGTRCACYAYEVRRTIRARTSQDILFAWGFALTPSHVATPWGVARLLSYTDIEETAPQLVDPAIKRRAAAYFASTPLQPTGYGTPGLGIAAVKELHSDQDGNIKGDFGPLPSDFLEGDYRLYEKVLVDREPITAIGTWDSRLGGMKAERGFELTVPVVVRRGPPEKARSKLLKDAIIGGVFALVPLAIAALIVWMFIQKAGGLFY